MASGCEFVCENKECKHYKSGINMLAPWPLGDIDKIMTLPHVIKVTELMEDLKRVKGKGRKYACINYPNTKHIETLGYRVEMFCPSCPAHWAYDVMLSDTVTSPDSAIIDPSVEKKCPKCDTKLKTMMELLSEEDGVYCPHCKEKMHKHTWFSNETNEEIL